MVKSETVSTEQIIAVATFLKMELWKKKQNPLN